MQTVEATNNEANARINMSNSNSDNIIIIMSNIISDNIINISDSNTTVIHSSVHQHHHHQ